MKIRVNKRILNLATVPIDILEEDKNRMSGLLSIGQYFSTEDRKEVKITCESNKWIYEQTQIPVKNNKYMYAVGPNGSLYIRHVSFHSQFKAGRAVQSAGYITYNSNAYSHLPDILIDNNSGHYQPTLSQFLSTLCGLHKAKILPDNFNIQLRANTKMDYSFDVSFFAGAAKETIECKLGSIINVSYQKSINGFIFTNKQREIVLLVEQIVEKGDFENSSSSSRLYNRSVN